MANAGLAPYNVPDLPSADEIMPYLRRIDSTRQYSNFGPLIKELEDRLRQHMDRSDPFAKDAPVALVTMANGYLALTTALQLFHLPEMAKVLVPAVTFTACPLAVRHSGAEPVLVDIDPISWTLTPEIARRIVEKNKIHAVMPVAVYGVPLPVEGWDEFVSDTGIPVIIDAAAAFDVQIIPKNCLVAFSFHATKPFGIGEGGLLVGRNHDQISEAHLLSNFGTRERITLLDGCNAKMSEYNGAVAQAQLDRWEQVKRRRHDRFALFQEAFRANPLKIKFQQGIDQSLISSLMLDIESGKAVETTEALKDAGIGAHRTYLPPLYHHPNFWNLEVVNTDGEPLSRGYDLAKKIKHMPGAEEMMRNIIGLPFHAFLQEADIDRTVTILGKILTSVP